jgi:hypothetical protein
VKIKSTICLIMICGVAMVCSGCAPEMITKREAYPQMYSPAKPLTILVLPAMNDTTAADASGYFMSTIAKPMTLGGYYLLPTEVITPLLQAEGLTDSEMIINSPLDKFKTVLGADAVLFVKIKQWDVSYYIIGGHLTVALEMRLKSTTTNDVLWSRFGVFKVDTTVRGGGGIGGLAVQIVGTAIKTAASDYMVPAQGASRISVSSIPVGTYHPRSGQDGDDKIRK